MLEYSDDDPCTLNLKKNPTLWREYALSLCRRHGVETTEFWSAYPSGASLVAAVSDKAVIKIIQPSFQEEWRREHWAYEKFKAKNFLLKVEIPELLASGQEEGGWTYLILSKASGIELDKVWDRIEDKNKASIMFEIGQLMSRVHSIPLSRSHLHRLEWKAFFDKQISNCRSHHQRHNLPDCLIRDINQYVAKNLNLFQDDFLPVLLTGEYTPFNLLVTEKGGVWHLSGMLDFADSMAGPHEYDLIGPGVFLGAGNAVMIASLLQGYGLEKKDEKLRSKIMVLHLLHQFSNFKAQIALVDWDKKSNSLDELAQLLWPFN